ncbi:hypothetical protein PAMP_025203 [Pampus punctatissimus]
MRRRRHEGKRSARGYLESPKRPGRPERHPAWVLGLINARIPEGVPPQSNSPPATVPGAGHGPGGRALDTRSESPLGARLPASPVGFPWSAPVLSQLLGASRGDPPGPRANGGPTGAVAGEIREKGPARVQSRRRRPPVPGPPADPPSARRGHRPAKTPRPATREAPRSRGPARRAARRASGGGERRATGRLLPPAAARAQPRFAPQPDRPSP